MRRTAWLKTLIRRLRGPAPSLSEGLLYVAFLSYRSTDGPTARWLHRKLEGYRVPWRFVGTLGTNGRTIPRRIQPIFRDRDNARTAADVETVLAEELSRSDQLIVLCTPNAAGVQSWVGREIEIFRERRPAGAIHAIIAEGDPPNCFPVQLLRRDERGGLRQPLAADLRPIAIGGDGESRAIVKLVAGLLGADFDALWGRDRRRRMWRAVGATGAAVALALAAFLVVEARQRERDERLQRVAREARTVLQAGDVELAALLAIVALGPDADNDTSDTRQTLLDVFNTAPQLAFTLEGESSGQIVRRSVDPSDASVHAAFSQDGRRLASASSDRTFGRVRMWDLQTRRKVWEVVWKRDDRAPYRHEPDGLLFDPTGTRLAVAMKGGTLHLLDVSGGAPRGTSLPQTNGWVIADRMVFTPDGNVLASSNAGLGINLWDVADVSRPRPGMLRVPNSPRSLAISPDSQTLAVSSFSGNVVLFDLRSQRSRVLAHKGPSVDALAFAPDGTMLYGATQKSVLAWSLASPRPVEEKDLPSDWTAHDIRWIIPGRELLATWHATGTQLKRETLAATSVNPAYVSGPAFESSGQLAAEAVSADGRWVATVAPGGRIRVWHRAERPAVPISAVLRMSGSPGLAAMQSDASAIAAVSRDYLVQDSSRLAYWHTDQSGAFVRRELPVSDGVEKVEFRPDRSAILLTWVGGRTFQLVEVPSMRASAMIARDDGPIGFYRSAVAPDGRRIVTTGPAGSIAWTLDRPADPPLILSRQPATALAFNDAGTHLALAEADRLRILGWPDTAARESILEPTALDGFPGLSSKVFPVERVVFSPSSSQILVASRFDEVVAIDTTQMKPLWTVKASPKSIAFGGDMLYMHAPDGLSLWDVTRGERLGRLSRFTVPFAPSAADRVAVAGAEEEGVQVLDMALSAWAQRACEIASRPISEAEWARYIDSELEDYRPVCARQSP
jgi:WD40 repeat protein